MVANRDKITSITYLLITCDDKGNIVRAEVPDRIIIEGDARRFRRANRKVEIDGIFGWNMNIKPCRLGYQIVMSNNLIARLVNHLIQTEWSVVSASEQVKGTLELGGKLSEIDIA